MKRPFSDPKITVITIPIIVEGSLSGASLRIELLKDHRGKWFGKAQAALPSELFRFTAEVGFEPTTCRVGVEVTLPCASMIFLAFTLWCWPSVSIFAHFLTNEHGESITTTKNFSIPSLSSSCYNNRIDLLATEASYG